MSTFRDRLCKLTMSAGRAINSDLCIGKFPREACDAIRLGESGKALLDSKLIQLDRFIGNVGTRQQHSEYPGASKQSFRTSGEPPAFQKITNALYVPEHRCLFSCEGVKIGHSVSSRRRDKIPTTIRLPDKVFEVRQEMLYIGDFEDFHYGHFLVEGISHLWGIQKFPDLPMFYPGMRFSPGGLKLRMGASYIDSFMNLIGLNRNHLYLSGKPIRFQSLVLPDPSLLFGQSVHMNHKWFPEFAAYCHLGLSGCVSATSQPLYISRSRVKNGARKLFGEDRLETILRSRGVRIVHPETLSLKSQINLFNEHKYFIGCQGSALHGMLFCLADDLKMFCLTSSDTWLDTFRMIDYVKSIDSNYIDALRQCGDASRSEWMRDKELDVDMAVSVLESSGII